MEVPRTRFYGTLPHMLSLAQHARFVAIDLEMSGIAVPNAGSDSSATSPQEAYAQAKKAAETFAILEIGLTFIQYDEGLSKYSTKTFNIPLSPEMPFERLQHQTALELTRRLDRIVGISMDSLKFLKDNKFDLNKSFTDGCFFLGRHEEKAAREWAHSHPFRNEQPSSDAIDLSTLSEELSSFYARARLTIEDAVTRPNRKTDATVAIHDPLFKPLSTLHIALIKHLVREEYRQCRVLPSPSPVQRIKVLVTRQNLQSEEDRVIAEKLYDVENIVGFRYLFEALAGGSFTPKAQHHWTTPARPQPGLGGYGYHRPKFDISKCEEALKKSRPSIIGHNIFYDLVFIYRTFFGPLPDDLDEFLSEIHELFPRIIDTKYLATRKPQGNSGSSYASLQGLYGEYEKYQFPRFATDHGYGYQKLCSTQYGAQQAQSGHAHMAGYDSEMTGKLFCRLGHALFAKKQHLVPVSEAIYTPTSQRAGKDPSSSSDTPTLLDEDEDTLAELKGLQLHHPALLASTSKQTKTESASVPKTQSAPMPKPESAPMPSPMPGESYSPRETHILPVWSDHFWAVYGNKTRVGGAGVVSFV